MKRAALLLPLLAVLGACSSASGPAPALSPAAQVYSLQVAYKAPLLLAVAYNQRPRCDAPKAPVVCSDRGVVEQLRHANDAAVATLTAAENVARASASRAGVALAITAAENAIKAVSAILATYKVE
jgi:hypothetical protein